MRRRKAGMRLTKKREQAPLAGRLAGALPVSSAEGRARVAEWLAAIARTATGKALKASLAQHPRLASLLGGIAAAAPDLWDLIRADPARFVRVIGGDPEDELAALLAKTRSTAAAARGSAALTR